MAITATDPTADDQALSQDFFFLHYSGGKIKVGLDVGLSIFASINATAHEFSISSNGIYHPSSGTSPISIIHANGDKSNIAALERYFHTWVDNTSERPLTLKVLRTDRGYANLDSEAKKLIFGEEFGRNSVLFALVGNRRGCAFVGGQQGCMTFDGSANVYINRDDIHNWEVVDVRGTPKSFHGLELSRYFLEQPGFARLSDVTLSELKPEFAKLFCEHLKNYSRQLMSKPWIGPRYSSEE